LARYETTKDPTTQKRKGNSMSITRQMFQYYQIRLDASREMDRERGEVSATTVVMTAALVALAITVGAIISARVRDKANSLNLG
jgi:fatty acid desaturase